MSGSTNKSHPGGSGFLAAVVALALHVGGAALAIAHLQTDEADDALGATAIEVGLELASRAA